VWSFDRQILTGKKNTYQERTVLLPLCPQVLHGLAQDQNQFSSVFNFSKIRVIKQYAWYMYVKIHFVPYRE